MSLLLIPHADEADIYYGRGIDAIADQVCGSLALESPTIQYEQLVRYCSLLTEKM
jgi:hypothetical protein